MITAVIGLNYGDEGKGHMVDYFASQGADYVVRYCGGAQAGHTVVANGYGHIFHHFGSGTIDGTPTFLSRYFISNPAVFNDEWMRLGPLFAYPRRAMFPVVDPYSRVTTPFDMVLNQSKAEAGSTCGLGINETMKRNKAFPLVVRDLEKSGLVDKIVAIRDNWFKPRYMPAITGPDWFADSVIDHFLDDCRLFLHRTFISGPQIMAKQNLVFEGSQGLRLDQDYKDFPYVTHAHTGSKNIARILEEINDTRRVKVVYVTRSYLTRHGAGPLPGEVPMPESVVDTTNVDNEWQGKLRYAPLTRFGIDEMIAYDQKDRTFPHEVEVAVTCLDQEHIIHIPNAAGEKAFVKYQSHGPDRKDITEKKY